VRLSLDEERITDDERTASLENAIDFHIDGFEEGLR
jgi:hypothetical protein